MRRVQSVVAVMLLLCASLVASGPAAAASPPGLRAILAGRAIPVSQVSRLHCHDGAYPTIRCFQDPTARDRDAVRVANRRQADFGGPRRGGLAPLIVYYVRFYEHENYGGASYQASAPLPDFTQIGWNDTVTSFQSLSNGRPKWYQDVYYGGGSSRWSAGFWVANVGGDLNDTFSSVKNVP